MEIKKIWIAWYAPLSECRTVQYTHDCINQAHMQLAYDALYQSKIDTGEHSP
jgi:hypothetical protein